MASQCKHEIYWYVNLFSNGPIQVYQVEKIKWNLQKTILFLFCFSTKCSQHFCKPKNIKTLALNRLLPFFLQVSPIKDRTNSYTGMPLKLKHLIAKDNTGTAKVALWNDLAKEEYHQNDIIRLSNMKGTTFEQKKLLGSTPNSKVEVSMNQVCMIYWSHKSHKLQIFPAFYQRRVCSITVSHKLFVGVLYNCMITKACSRQIVVEDFILEF